MNRLAMDRKHQLQWVQRNRHREGRVLRAGTMIQGIARQMKAEDEAVRVAGAVAELVDDEFRRHCRIAAVRSATVVVHVDHPSLVYSMQQQWLSPLSRALQGTDVGRRIRRIVFETGQDGVRVPRPTEQLASAGSRN
jgi:hypothetical protein